MLLDLKIGGFGVKNRKKPGKIWGVLGVGLIVVPILAVFLLLQSDSENTLAKPVTPNNSASPGPIDGWDLVFADNFERTELGQDWGTYSGSPGGDDYSQWDPSHVVLQDGKLILKGYQEDGQWLTGGVSNWPQTYTYGRWEVRFRADASDEITYHFLLWPQRETWPPEIDFMENFGGDRQSGEAFVHYLDANDKAAKTQVSLKDVDFTKWHTVGVEWEPGVVKFLLDGEEWDRIEEKSAVLIPAEPMWLGLQAQSGVCQRKADYGFADCPVVGTPETADVEIDWVAIYQKSS